MELIAERAGVTSGAFYHHFRDKRACFEAVYLTVEQELFDLITRAWQATRDPWTGMLAGSNAFLDACVAADIRQIILIDGPSVLGWDTWHEIEGRYHFGSMQYGLRVLMKASLLERQPPEPLAQLLFGALNEAARVIAHSKEPAKTRKDLGNAYARILIGLRSLPDGPALERVFRPS
jgi:AcrR family transcriptional regulator